MKTASDRRTRAVVAGRGGCCRGGGAKERSNARTRASACLLVAWPVSAASQPSRNFISRSATCQPLLRAMAMRPLFRVQYRRQVADAS